MRPALLKAAVMEFDAGPAVDASTDPMTSPSWE
jgi:hypothetical protein